jgi:hypothetical protein
MTKTTMIAAMMAPAAKAMASEIQEAGFSEAGPALVERPVAAPLLVLVDCLGAVPLDEVRVEVERAELVRLERGVTSYSS